MFGAGRWLPRAAEKQFKSEQDNGKAAEAKTGLAGGAGGEFDNLDARCVDLLVREARVGESLPGGFHGLEMAQFVEE